MTATNILTGNGVTNVPASLPIAGLTPLTQYQFLVQAQNGIGTVDSSVQFFFTSPPLVATLPADGVASAHANLHASVNPNGVQTKAWLEYGTTPGYGASTPLIDLGNGNGAQPTNALLSGLSPGTTYNFRAAASNSVGLAYGANFTFQTAPRALISSISQTNGQFLLQFNGTTGISYTLQVSTNLIQWLNLATLSPDSNGLFKYIAQTNGPANFFRLSNP
jgi:hypothetical protein